MENLHLIRFPIVEWKYWLIMMFFVAFDNIENSLIKEKSQDRKNACSHFTHKWNYSDDLLPIFFFKNKRGKGKKNFKRDGGFPLLQIHSICEINDG